MIDESACKARHGGSGCCSHVCRQPPPPVAHRRQLWRRSQQGCRHRAVALLHCLVHRGLPIAVLQAWGSLAAQQQAHNVEVPHIGSTVQRRAAARPRGCIWVGTQLQQQLYDVTMPRPGSEDQRREARIACRPSKGWQIQSL